MKNMPYRPNMSTKMKNKKIETSGEAPVRPESGLPAGAEIAIGVEVVERKIESLIKEISSRFDAEVYVTGLEEVEGYVFLYLHVVRDKFGLDDVQEIHEIIEKAGFVVRNSVEILSHKNKVKLFFDLRW
jgi:repressor of nif and glnA expression